MRPSEIRQLMTDELERELDNRCKEYFNLRFQAATQQIENCAQIRKVKRDIARMKTLLRERTADAAATPAPQTETTQ